MTNVTIALLRRIDSTDVRAQIVRLQDDKDVGISIVLGKGGKLAASFGARHCCFGRACRVSWWHRPDRPIFCWQRGGLLDQSVS
jgi:hypothetical protein